MRRFLTLLAAGLFAAGGTLAADDAITIKVKQPGPGDVVKETKTEKGVNKLTLNAPGVDQANEEKVNTKFAYTDEVIEKPAGAKQPNKVKRTYETASISKGTKEEEVGLAGKVVLIEKKGDKYSFTIDGKDVPRLAADILRKEFGKDKEITEEDFLPKGPVKVGDVWKLDIAKFAKDLSSDAEMTADVDKSSGTGKLLKVYDKDGHKFGVMEVKLELVITKGGRQGQVMEMKPGSSMKVTANIDACIDGTLADGKSKVHVKADLEGSMNNITVKVDSTAEEEATTEEVKKK